MVCLGNICRSPMAQGVLEHAAAARSLKLHVDSAGTSGWHMGDGPDPRAIDAAARRGYAIAGQRARGVTVEDFTAFDLMLAMDAANLTALRRRAPADATARIRRLLPDLDVPDPYYDGPAQFDEALDLIERGVAEVLRELAPAMR
jgi:protein-tyrosine phosphatase